MAQRHVYMYIFKDYLLGKCKYHETNIKVYFLNPVGIGEHPDVVAEAKKLVEEIEHARHCREIVQSMK